MLLPVLTEFGIEAARPRYATAARTIGFAAEGDDDAAACRKLIEGLRALNRELAVPSPRAYGIDERVWDAKLALMAEQALASGSPGNNPRVPTAAEIVDLYRQVWAEGLRNTG